VADIEIGAFLKSGGQGPEHRELLRLIGTLAEGRHMPRGPEGPSSAELASYVLPAPHDLSESEANRNGCE
jgi:hypothetical protein